MYKIYRLWRYYTLDKPQYLQSMERIFHVNLNRLCVQNRLVALMVVLFIFVPLFLDQDITTVVVYVSIALSAIVLCAASMLLRKRLNEGKGVSRFTIYLLISISYAVIVFFGIHLSIIINPDRPASVYLPIIVVALYFFTVPAHFKLTLTLIGWLAFLAFAIMIKLPVWWIYDLLNSSVAIVLSLIVGWYGAKQHMVTTYNSIILEDVCVTLEQQSLEDELTKLRNRRDFMINLERFLNKPRYPDDAFCLAYADIDYFKKYNDHYGHVMGDECLRIIGTVFNEISSSKSVYSARIGGEEFAMLWFVGSESVEDVLRLLHDKMRSANIPHERSDVASYVTFSIGAYVLNCDSEDDTFSVSERADKALYEAKQSGRNKTVIYDDRRKGE